MASPKNKIIWFAIFFLWLFLLAFIFFNTLSLFKAKDVSITADSNRIDLRAVRTALLNVNLLISGEKEIKNSLNKIDWVGNSIVETKWPDSIYVRIYATKPVADVIFYDSKDYKDISAYVLDNIGRLIYNSSNTYGQNITIKLEKSYASYHDNMLLKKIVDLYENIRDALANYKITLNYITADKNGLFTLYLGNNIKLFVESVDNITTNIHTFFKALEYISEKKIPDIDYINLRYKDKGFAIGYKKH